MGLLISDKIRTVKYSDYSLNKHFFMRIEKDGRAYADYLDCKHRRNPITDEHMLRAVLPKLKDFIEKQIKDNPKVEEEKKNIAIKELTVIFENIYKANFS